MKFIHDERGRVPFAVLGILLIVGSAVTSGIVTNLEKERTKNVAATLKSSSIKNMLKNAEADISRMLSYSCLRALKKIGRHPVTYSNVSTAAAAMYADFDGDGEHHDDVGDTVQGKREVMAFNKNWARNMARVYFNTCLNKTLEGFMYRDNGYSIAVHDPDGDGAVDDWRDITFRSVGMELERSVAVDLLVSEDTCEYSVYWVASIPDLSLKIRNLSSGKYWRTTANISCLVPSRLPLLMNLTYTYQDSINGPLSPLMGLVSVIGEGYTEARSLLQYAGKYDLVKNIVDNRWLQYLTNAGLVGIQYLVFNSIDPMMVAQLATQVNDLVARGARYGTSSTSDILTGMASMPFINGEDVFKTFGSENDSEARRALQNTTGSQRISRANVSLWNMSRAILNQTRTTYYYYNDSTGLKPQDTWRGYMFTDQGYRYHLASPDGDPDTDTDAPLPGFRRQYTDRINRSVLQEIHKQVRDTYSASFSTRLSKSVLNVSYTGCTPSDPDWRHARNTSCWDLVQSSFRNSTTGRRLHDGGIPSGFPATPYRETWTLRWKRNETWEHYEVVNHTEAGNPVYGWKKYRDVIHSVDERATFALQAEAYPRDVKQVMHTTSVFGAPPHQRHVDDNLAFLLQTYVNDGFTDARDRYTDTARDHGKGYNGTVDSVHWHNNTADGDTTGYDRIQWVIGRPDSMGAAARALYNITSMIRADRAAYSTISGRYYSPDDPTVNLSLVEQERHALLQEFQRRKNSYVNQQHYMEDGKYTSAAARVIVEMRRWFVEQIAEQLNTSHTRYAEDAINERVSSRDNGHFSGYQTYQNTIDTYKDAVDQLTHVQFGSQMRLEGNWTENMTLTVGTTPDYFDFNDPPSGEENWEFNVKNICLFGPTGLPLLPTPVTPWVVTINSWYIHVDGHWDTFMVLDSSDETHPDPLLGHSGQTCIRTGPERVRDRVCYQDNPCLGFCTPLTFGFDTMNLGIVPSGKLPIGDLDTPVESDSVGKGGKR